jgi:SagB-type dehydrogenase family enzyme
MTKDDEEEARDVLQEHVFLAGRNRYPYPTPGAVNGLRIILASGNVSGLKEGCYRFDQDAHTLTGLTEFPFRQFCAEVLPGLDWTSASAAVLLVVGQVAIRRDYRHPYLLCLSEAGHLLQNLQLVATALDLASCELGSIEEDALFAFMGTKDYQEVPMGAIAIGSLP